MSVETSDRLRLKIKNLNSVRSNHQEITAKIPKTGILSVETNSRLRLKIKNLNFDRRNQQQITAKIPKTEFRP